MQDGKETGVGSAGEGDIAVHMLPSGKILERREGELNSTPSLGGSQRIKDLIECFQESRVARAGGRGAFVKKEGAEP